MPGVISSPNLRYTSNMKIPIGPLAILIFVLNFSGKTVLFPEPEKSSNTAKRNPEKEEDKEFIPWLHERMLNWEDFQCAPQRNTDAVASTSTSLGLAYQFDGRKLSYSITCKFSKTKSWGALKTDYILAHEQGHFDVTEIYARKLHHALTAYTVNSRTYKNDINRIYEKIVKEKEHLQNLYDGQSDHSRNRKVQANWAEIIGALLEETEPYANYP